ncbi:hypothetical protein AK812_SmicGene9136 [Symbiodinium microadriaticum]|uniref:Uncharacterized protein n=1 Tax=Symbiodinium microadriaticum TaxID=2951 RepID=A0A1Q9EJ24_SYMMI|nr:hypothetical protein AK812_SmicGene9136 [Symbiodinium microadriaticum]
MCQVGGDQVPWDGAVDATLALSTFGSYKSEAHDRLIGERFTAALVRASTDPDEEKGGGAEEEAKFGEQRHSVRKGVRQEDLKARREAEEKTRKEQAATLAVRKAILATLEETQANNLAVSEEATRALEEAQRRIDEIHNKRVAEEKLKKEMEVKVEAFIKETKEEGAAMLAKVKETEALVEKLKQPEGSPEEIVAAAESAEKVKREILELVSRLAAGVRLMERSETVVKSALARAEKKTAALQKLAERDREFAEFDKDKDVLDLILSKLEPALPPFALERQRKLEEERKAAQAALAEVSSLYTTAEESAATKAAMADELMKMSESGTEELIINSRERFEARPLIKESDKASDEIVAEADEAEALASRAEQELQTASAKNGEQKESLEENPNLKANAQQELQRLDQRLGSALADLLRLSNIRREKSLKGRALTVDMVLSGRLSKIVAAVKLAKEKAKRKAFAEFDQKRTECATAIRAKMNAEAKTADQFFEERSSALTEEVFASFLNGSLGW